MEDDRFVDRSDQIIREMIAKEDTLLNNRISWLITMQGLLFAGLALFWDKQDSNGLVIVFALLGILVALSAQAIFPFYSKSSKNLISWWDKHKPIDYKGPDIVGFRSEHSGILWLLRPWRALPVIFIIAWLAILLTHFAR